MNLRAYIDNTNIYLKENLKGDRTIWMIFGILSVISLFAVYSSSGTLAYMDKNGNTLYYLMKQVVHIGIGFSFAFLLHKIYYVNYAKMAPFMLVATIILLAVTLFFGIEINGARRWLPLPFGFSFQTSDFAELALIIYVAKAISLNQENIKNKKVFFSLLMPIVLVCGLIAPANLSTAALLFAACMALMIIGRVNMKYVLLLVVLGLIMMAILIFLGKYIPAFGRVDTWISRVNEFITSSDGGYQVQQSKMAIAEGSWTGLGPGNSIQRNYLPFAYADFIYAIIIEEYGLILGGMGILILYLWFFYRCIRIISRSKKTFGAMLAIGLGLHITIQALANMAVSVNLVPVTGLTLPLVSAGGTSLIFTCMMIGIILSVSRHIENQSGVPAANENKAAANSIAADNGITPHGA